MTELPRGSQKHALPSEARPVTGTRHMTHRVTKQDTDRVLQGTARDPGATEAHPQTSKTVPPLTKAGMPITAEPPWRTLPRTRVSFILANADG